MNDSPPKLRCLELTLAQSSTLDFYQDVLGMSVGEDTFLRFPGQDFGLSLIVDPQAKALPATGQDGYWKIGITVADLNRAVTRLQERGHHVSEPKQFRDIGYLCHTQDPEGLTIELLAHQFEGKADRQSHDDSPLGSTARLGQVTLRINDAEESLAFYTESLGMTLLSIQPVEPYRFTLYFLADRADTPPVPELDSVANREWLWQRPYPTLELQHLWDGGAQPAHKSGVGYRALVFDEGRTEQSDPDGHRLRV